jgi:serine/threonine-protein kinase RsbW
MRNREVQVECCQIMKLLSTPPVVDGKTFATGASFEMQGSIDALSPTVDAVMAFVAQQNGLLGEEKESQLQLALQEALANAVVHGCKNDASKTVTCQVACDPALGVAVVVRDPGPGFDTENLPNPLSAEGLARHQGRGVHLMLQLMDEVRYERGGRELHMRKA